MSNFPVLNYVRGFYEVSSNSLWSRKQVVESITLLSASHVMKVTYDSIPETSRRIVDEIPDGGGDIGYLLELLCERSDENICNDPLFWPPPRSRVRSRLVTVPHHGGRTRS